MYLDELERPQCGVTGMMVSEGNHPQMVQHFSYLHVSELISFNMIQPDCINLKFGVDNQVNPDKATQLVHWIYFEYMGLRWGCSGDTQSVG